MNEAGRGERKKMTPRWARATTTNYTTHTDAVIDIRYHPSGQLITTRGRDNVVCLWDSRNMKVFSYSSNHSIETIKVDSKY